MMEIEATTTETKPERPTWPDDPFACFPVLWKTNGVWRVRVLRQQFKGQTNRWEDTGEFPRNDQFDGMAAVLRAETEALGEEAIAIAAKKKIPARPCRPTLNGFDVDPHDVGGSVDRGMAACVTSMRRPVPPVQPDAPVIGVLDGRLVEVRCTAPVERATPALRAKRPRGQRIVTDATPAPVDLDEQKRRRVEAGHKAWATIQANRAAKLAAAAEG